MWDLTHPYQICPHASSLIRTLVYLELNTHFCSVEQSSSSFQIVSMAEPVWPTWLPRAPSSHGYLGLVTSAVTAWRSKATKNWRKIGLAWPPTSPTWQQAPATQSRCSLLSVRETSILRRSPSTPVSKIILLFRFIYKICSVSCKLLINSLVFFSLDVLFFWF